jgi:uncharacterized protein YbaP (TraB family)
MKTFVSNLLFFFLLIQISPAVYSQTSGPGIELEIWHGSQLKGYLVGTMHRFPNGYETEFSNKFKDVISKSDGLVTELGMAQFILLSDSTNIALEKSRDKKTLSSIISPDLFEQIATQLTPAFGSETKKLLDITHPWAVGNALLGLCSIEANSVSMEDQLALIASEKNKPIFALESVAEQVKGLPAYTSNVWTSYLRSLSTFSKRPDCADLYRDVVTDMSKTVIAGDLGLLPVVLEKNYKILDTKNFDDVFVYERNPHLLERMLTKLHSGKLYIFAFGGLHLIGEKGLIAGLEKNGYVVKRLAQ